MHTNHRRKNKFRGKHHNCHPNRSGYRYWHPPLSMKEYRQQEARRFRALERGLMAHEEYDQLPQKVVKILYWWWFEWDWL